MTLRVVLEVAPKKAFASALDWPGWARAGKTDDDALQSLLDYAPRYAPVAGRAKVAFSPPATLRGIEVVERLPGGGTTEFGVPGKAAAAEDEALAATELKRLLRLLQAAWATFDAAAKGASGVELARGPRGGGRDLAKIIGHVRDAEVAYLNQLGSRAPASADKRAPASIALLRSTFTDALGAVARGEPLADPNRTRKRWSPRYAIRRSAWHSLDHAWEIEDRAS